MVDIARKLEINVSTCHNILRTLRDEGMVHYDSIRKIYAIGLPIITSFNRLLQMGFGMYPVIPTMQSISDKTSMSAILGDAIGRTNIRMLASTHPSSLMSLSMPTFESVPILSGAMGRVVAAWGGMSDEFLRRLFRESGHDSTFGFDDYMQGVEAARVDGWAIDNGTWQRGIWGIAVPVPNPANKVEQILCLTCAAGAITPDQVPAIGQMLVQTARQIADGSH